MFSLSERHRGARRTWRPVVAARMSAATPAPHRIVIIGGGAGGLELATRLGNTLGASGRAQVTLVDRSETHMWKPLLHEVAAGSLTCTRTRSTSWRRRIGIISHSAWARSKRSIAQRAA